MAKRKRKNAGLTAYEVNTYEVEWYRAHGKYPDERIQIDNFGREYVIADIRWNRLHPYRRESVFKPLSEHLAKRCTGIRS